MNKMEKIFLSLAMSLLGTAAFAEGEVKSGLFIEPAVSFETSSSKVDYPSPFSHSTGKVQGFGLGLTGGMHVGEAFYLGLAGRYSIPQVEDSAFNYSGKATAMNWGPVIGAQMPDLGLRLWGTYILDGTLDPEKKGTLDVKFSQGTGYRLGVGFRVAAVSLNLEYQDMKYSKGTLQSIGSFAAGTDFKSVEPSNKSWIASVSFPIEL